MDKIKKREHIVSIHTASIQDMVTLSSYVKCST